LLVPEVRVVLHHVPQDGTISDGNHGFGNILRVLTDAHSQPPTKQNDFHCVRLLTRAVARVTNRYRRSARTPRDPACAGRRTRAAAVPTSPPRRAALRIPSSV